MPFPFLIPLMAAAGAGIGALANKKHRGRGALIGAGLGALGGAGLGAVGGASGAAAGLSGNIGPFANGAKYAGALKMGRAMQGLGALKKAAPLLQGLGRQPEQEDPGQPIQPMPQALPPMSLNPHPMAPPVMMSSFPYGGYYG